LRVFLTGATGFIGGYLLRALADHGHRVTCLVRPGRRLPEEFCRPNVRTVEAEFTRPETWRQHVAGHEAVVNTVGILRERHGATYAAVHTEAPVALFRAAAEAGVRKIVQLSALGADPESNGAFLRSKGAADVALAEMGVPYVVLRPSFVSGPGDHSMSFFRRLAALPITPVPGDGQYRVQPLRVEDLVGALVMAVERDDLRGLTVNVGGGRALTFDELLDELARDLGKPRRARKWHVPWWLMRGAAALTDLAGGRGPITRDELRMLRHGSTTDNHQFVERFGFEPAPFSGRGG
jgi:NADH dehydrogenase